MKFKCDYIGIIGIPRSLNSIGIYRKLFYWLTNLGYKVIFEKQTASILSLRAIEIVSIFDIGEFCDLAIVIGGDGNMLKALKVLSKYNIKVVGINKGNLGFLTDLNIINYKQDLINVLDGKFILDRRFMLEIFVYKKNIFLGNDIALNEFILHSNKIAHMIEFKVFIDKFFAFSQRSDGLIISTSTGSTAYSLSVGGPIIFPLLNVVSVLPIFPHTLSTRPIIISANSIIDLYVNRSKYPFKIYCDNKDMKLLIDDNLHILIKRTNYSVNLIHPLNYNYFDILRNKLNWLKKTF
ncbi:NAD(+)/NADH kinase [Candidatus Purcelliella pentastirinorum]|uniref:NAD kinase n=1 Tax=Candidatus Purcelliella pentastirinorum TaxID=472834 RepID=A0AAX3N8V2_9ENTR|nr:NAD(+)/NADH kinase [Candidatus Purcelliella pentastirinorum]WDI78532.1 NAD(+)/NADH kinase [Candidatus Purcelliella pentastirinorum]WDR80439.1 NAD(+)/NADH kinase [Candidatus Purcelliella pentastirinorum]